MNLIDIHNHSLYGVDDGAADERMCREMLVQSARQGVDGIILTPHRRRQMFHYPVSEIEEKFRVMQTWAGEEGIRLWLGCEYHAGPDLFRELEHHSFHTMADSRYILTEYPSSGTIRQIEEYTQELIQRGYCPIIAHIERIEVFSRIPALICDIRDRGAMVQVNADSVLGLEGLRTAHMVRKALKEGLVDFIGSDAHDVTDRASHLGRCREYVIKKYGKDSAHTIFASNPLMLTEKAD